MERQNFSKLDLRMNIYDRAFKKYHQPSFSDRGEITVGRLAGLVFQELVEEEINSKAKLHWQILRILKDQGIEPGNTITEADPELREILNQLDEKHYFSPDGLVFDSKNGRLVVGIIEIKLGHFNLGQINKVTEGLRNHSRETGRLQISDNPPIIVVLPSEFESSLGPEVKDWKLKQSNVWVIYSEVSSSEILENSRKFLGKAEEA